MQEPERERRGVADRKWWAAAAAIALAVLLVVLLAGRHGGSSGGQRRGGVHGQLGETVTVGSAQLVVGKVVDPYVPTGIETGLVERAPSGERYVAVQLNVRNTGPHDLDLGGVLFAVRGTNGQSYGPETLQVGLPGPPTQPLPPGEQATPTLVFAIPSGVRPASFVYQASTLRASRSPQAIVALQSSGTLPLQGQGGTGFPVSGGPQRVFLGPAVHLTMAPQLGPNQKTTRVSVQATSAPFLTTQTLQSNNQDTLPAGRMLVAVRARLTNIDSHPLSLAGFNDYGLNAGFDGEFDVPKIVYESAFGNQNAQLFGGPSAPYSCHQTDQPIRGDCEIGFRAEVDTSATNVPPGGSIPLILRSDVINGTFTYAGSVPPSFDVGRVRVFIRDPRDERGRDMVPCFDPRHPPVGILAYFLTAPGKPPSYACEPGLTLELRYPGETAPNLTYDPSLAPDGPLGCRIAGEDSESDSALTLFSLRHGETTDIEKSWRFDGGNAAPDHWWVTSRGDQFNGVEFGAGAELGPVSDIEVRGGFTFGTAVDMQFDNKQQADSVVEAFSGKLASNPAAERQAVELATQHVDTSYTSSGVDLEGSFGGAPGKIEGTAMRARGVRRYRNGDYGIYNTLDIHGDIGSNGPLALGAGGVHTMELDLDNQDAFVALKTDTDVDVSARLFNLDLTGPSKKVLSIIKDKVVTESPLSGGGSASAGAGLSLEEEVDMPKSLPESDARTVLAAAEHLLTELQNAPNQLPADLGGVADSLSSYAEDSLVISRQGQTHSGVPFKFGAILRFGLEFGKTVTTESAIAAFIKHPDGNYQAFTDCVPINWRFP